MKYGVIIGARTASSRLPSKALLPLKGLPMIVFLIKRLKSSQLANQIVFATSNLPQDDQLASVVSREGISVFRGDQSNVVKRYVEAAQMYGFEYVVRETGDCPFINSETLDYCIGSCMKWEKFDLATTKTLFPKGIDYEIYNASTMKELYDSAALSPGDCEHLTLYFYNNKMKFNIRKIKPRPKWRCEEHIFTVDTMEDYNKARQIADNFIDINFSVESLIGAANKRHHRMRK